MTVGKPNFNLNSFGVKYLSKDEVQEFLNKYKIPHGDDQEALRTEREGKQGGKFQASESSKKLLTPTTPKPKEKPAVATSSTISSPNAAGNKKLQGGTRSQFMSRETPSKLSHTERKLRQDMESSGTKVDTSGIVTQRQKPQPETKPNEGKAPNRPTEHVGSIVDGGKVQGMDSKGNKRTISDASVKKEPKERSSAETTGKKGTKQLPKHVGDAPKGTKSEKELVGGRNVKVGVGSRAHKKLEKDPQGELTESQKPKEDKPDGRKGVKVDLNTQNRTSRSVTAHNKRGKENSKWYSEEQRAAYKKIDPKDRNAQAKFHSEQEKKYGKSVSTPKKLSAAGQSIKDKLSKKSNDIILKMNIMKLDGFAEESASTRRATNYKEGVRKLPKTGTKSPIEGGDQGTWNTHNYPNITDDARLVPSSESTSWEVNDDNERERIQRQGTKQLPKGGKSPKDLGKSANETLFKAISLKLNLMNKKDDWDKNERENERSRGGSPDKSKLPFGVRQSMLHSQGVSRSGKGLKGKKINPKKQTSGEDAEEYGKIYDKQNETLKSQAEETIFKAISLKLDLAKTLASNAGSELVAAGTKKGKPNHINDKGERTQDGQHTVRGHGVGTPEQVTIDGVKTTQPRTVAVKPKGNKKRSLAGDMQMSKELENKTPTQLKESMDYITNSPAYQESIHRDAPLTEKEGTEKFDNADPKTQAIRARIAARNAKKKSIDEINAMTDSMKELLKRDGVKIGMGEKDTRQMQDRFNEDHLSDFPEMKGTKEGKEVERHMNEHMQPIDNP